MWFLCNLSNTLKQEVCPSQHKKAEVSQVIKTRSPWYDMIMSWECDSTIVYQHSRLFSAMTIWHVPLYKDYICPMISHDTIPTHNS